MGLPSLPLTWWAENIGGPTNFGDYQIAHLPPPSASVGAARWAAILYCEDSAPRCGTRARNIPAGGKKEKAKYRRRAG